MKSIRIELQNYVKSYYPELIQDFNDASGILSVFGFEQWLLADNLHYHIDRSIQETVLQYGSTTFINLQYCLKHMDLKYPGQRPSVSVVDFSITVPALGDKEDERYLGTLTRGSQAFRCLVLFLKLHRISILQTLITVQDSQTD
jgi:hypothetical protein